MTCTWGVCTGYDALIVVALLRAAEHTSYFREQAGALLAVRDCEGEIGVLAYTVNLG